MRSKHPIYWKFFNLVGKLFGVVFAVGGGLLFAWSVANAISARDKFVAIIGCVMSAVVTIFGVLIIIAKPSHVDD